MANLSKRSNFDPAIHQAKVEISYDQSIYFRDFG